MENGPESANPARKTYPCHICDRTFIRLHRLQSHIRTHKKRKIDSNTATQSPKANSESLQSPKQKSPKSNKIAPVAGVSKWIQNAVAHNKKIAMFASSADEDLPQNTTENNKKDNETISSSTDERVSNSVQNSLQHMKQQRSSITVSTVKANSMFHPNPIVDKRNVFETTATNSSRNPKDVKRSISTSRKMAEPKSAILSKKVAEDFRQKFTPSPAIADHTPVGNPTNHTSYFDENIVIKTEIIEEVVETTDEGESESTTAPRRNKVLYSCDVCQMLFTNKCHLGRHTLTHTKQKPHVCKVCYRGFTQIGNLNVHYRTHLSTQNEDNSESHSPITNEAPAEFRKIRLVSKQKFNYECEICGKEFNNRCYLERHSFTHTKEKPHVCTVCFKGFAQVGNLNVHYLTHTNLKAFVCHVCDKAFTLMGSLKAHLLTHMEQKPFTCDVCGKGFSNKCFLKRHFLTHTDTKPYVCSVCHKGFVQVGNLNVHFLTHTKERDFKCDVCSKAFSRKVYLNKHYKQHLSENNVVS